VIGRPPSPFLFSLARFSRGGSGAGAPGGRGGRRFRLRPRAVEPALCAPRSAPKFARRSPHLWQPSRAVIRYVLEFGGGNRLQGRCRALVLRDRSQLPSQPRESGRADEDGDCVLRGLALGSISRRSTRKTACFSMDRLLQIKTLPEWMLA
jgi:hypothetical protein